MSFYINNGSKHDADDGDSNLDINTRSAETTMVSHIGTPVNIKPKSNPWRNLTNKV